MFSETVKRGGGRLKTEESFSGGKRRVAFFSGDITRGGGTERVGTIIANALCARGQYEIFVVSLTEEHEAAFKLSERIVREAFSDRWITPGPGYVPVIFKLRRFVKRHRIDVLVDIDGVLDVLSLPVKGMTGVKVVSWEHFHFYEDMGTRYRGTIRRLAGRFADAIVTLTQMDRGFYLENLNIRHEICVIHNPADYFCVGEKPVRDFAKKELLSVGGLVPAKGFLRIPRIAQLLKERYGGNFTWRIAGEGEQRAEIEAEILRRGVGDCVKLEGFVTDVAPLYARALVYVMTSEHEGLPMVLLEAKRFSLPAVSFDIRTGPSELIEDGVGGFLIPVSDDGEAHLVAMADEIGRLLTDEACYRAFEAHAGDHLEDFSTEKAAGQWEALLGRLLG